MQVSPNDGLESTTSCKDTVDLSEITNLCQTKFKHPKLGYLNINTLQNKIVDLRSIIHDLDLTFLAIAETKLNESYPNAQFFIDGYNNLQDFRRDRVYNNGGGLLVYIKKGIPCKRLRKFESDAIETVVVEIHLGSKKWCIVTIYRNEDVNPATFLENLSTSLDRILDEHENVIIIGDININSLVARKLVETHG